MTTIFPVTRRSSKRGGGVNRGGLSLAWTFLCTNVPQRLALPHGAQAVTAIGTEQRTTPQGGKPPARALCVTSMLPHAKIPGQISPSRSQLKNCGPGSWACGCTDNTLQVGGLAGLAPTTHSSSNRTHLFLMCTCPLPLLGPLDQVWLTPPSQGSGAQTQSWPLGVLPPWAGWLQVYKFWYPF